MSKKRRCDGDNTEASVERDPVTGRFAKGNSCGTGGKAKLPEELREAFRGASEEALETLIDVMRNGRRDADRVRAAEIILERGYGKAVVMELPSVQDNGGGVIYLPEVVPDDTDAVIVMEADDA